MNILGVSCFFHDSAACLVKDGQVVAAVQEERFSRRKQDARLPKLALEYCQGLAKDQIDYVVFYEKPFLKLERVLTSILTTCPKSYMVFRDVLFSWAREKMWVRNLLSEDTNVPLNRVLTIPHHLSHAASTFLCSPFNEAAILTIDGVGEWSTATIGRGERNSDGKPKITILKELRFPNSLGLLYSTFTAFLGFEVNEGEYKVMGMSAYGRSRFRKEIYQMVDIHPDGSLNLDLSYFSFHYHRTRSFSNKFLQVFGDPRNPKEDYVVGSPQAQHYADIAASIQEICEEIVIKMAKYVRKLVPSENLCLAGGVALNSVANYQLQQAGIFKHLYIQPAAGDAGGAVGAALYVNNLVRKTPNLIPAPHQVRGKTPAGIHHSQKKIPGQARNDILTFPHAYLGKSYSNQEITQFLKKEKLSAKQFRTESELINFTVKQLMSGRVIGWMQGAFEWGPRALGNRSILADARNPKMKDIVNSKVKFRELFRPFAPSVLADRADKIFEVPKKFLEEQPFGYMLFVVPVKKSKQKLVPAITHVNGTARPQFVNQDVNPLYYNLINAFYKKTGIPLILNTSFNLKGEPIVSSPADAFDTFKRSHIDNLVMGNFVLDRKTIEEDAF